MRNKDRNLLVFFSKKFISKQDEDGLHDLLLSVKSPEQFCSAHELVDRNRITADKRKIFKESGRIHLRAFRFLINKN